MLTKRELQTETVLLDDVEYTVTAFTVRRRTAFEAQLRRTGPESLRECTLIFCCTVGERPAFEARDYRDQAEASPEFLTLSKVKGVDKEALLDDLSLDLLVQDLASYPETQLEPLVMAAYRVNGLLGNDSSPS